MSYPYASFDDVVKRYPLIGQCVGASSLQVSTVDVSSIYVNDAQSYVDAYLGRRYVTPLVVEPILTSLASDIAIYRICEDKLPRFPQAVEPRYTNAMSILGMLRDGIMTLNLSSQQVTSGGDQDAWTTATSDAGPIFIEAERLTNTMSLSDPFFTLRNSG